MEATEMCHHWECRRKEEFCKWRDAQRKKQVGRGALYKEELAGPRSPGSLALAWVCSDFKGWRTKKTKTGPLHSSEKHSEPSVWISQAKISEEQIFNLLKSLKIQPTLPSLHLVTLTLVPRFTMATSMDTLPARLLPLVMEEFPQSLATACVCRAGRREPRLRCVQCGIIEEEEEDCSSLEEDQAQRSFLQTVESLRRSTRWAPS